MDVEGRLDSASSSLPRQFVESRQAHHYQGITSHIKAKTCSISKEDDLDATRWASLLHQDPILQALEMETVRTPPKFSSVTLSANLWATFCSPCRLNGEGCLFDRLLTFSFYFCMMSWPFFANKSLNFFLEETLTSDNYLGLLAIRATFREMF